MINCIIRNIRAWHVIKLIKLNKSGLIEMDLVLCTGEEQLEQSETTTADIRQKRNHAERWAGTAGESAQRSYGWLRRRGAAVHRR